MTERRRKAPPAKRSPRNPSSNARSSRSAPGRPAEPPTPHPSLTAGSSDQPLLSATLIARDEKHNVKRCLDSLWPWVDEVVLVDTGSKDGTVAEAKRYAQRAGRPGKLKTARFEDCNDEDGQIKDFAIARQAADDLASGRWLVWCDMDDETRGLDKLREMAANATDDVAGFFVRYSYARDESGNTISELWRERVVRNDGTRWTGRLHEHKLFVGPRMVVKVDPEIAEWIHHRDHEQRSGERNLRILEQWDREEPGDARIMHALAMEYMGAERLKDASDTFERFLHCDSEPPDRRAQATRHMCIMLMLQGRVQDARAAALHSLQETWLWADTHLTLAEAEQTLGRPDVALIHAQTAVTIGKPDTLLIINPLQYTAHPRALQAVCLAQMGRAEEAMAAAEECLQIAPTYQLVAQHLPLWRGQLRRQHALDAFLACAEVLCEVGELQKGRALLDQAPWFIAENERIVRRRVEISRQIQDRLCSPPAQVEDPAADAFIGRQLKEAA